jgi:hypothetical protein
MITYYAILNIIFQLLFQFMQAQQRGKRRSKMSKWRLDLLETAGKMEDAAAEREDQKRELFSPSAGS